MKTSKQISRGIAFVLNGEALESLVEMLSKFSNSLEFKVALSDATKVYPETLHELVKLPNPEHRQINEITIENDYKSQVRVEITLGGSSDYHSLWLSLVGDEADVLFLDHKIEDWLATIRQWYSWLAFSSYAKFMLGVAVYLIAAVLVFGRQVLPHFLPKTQLNFDILGLIGAGLMLGTWVVPIILRKLFPGAIFSIGAGTARYALLSDRRNQWRLWA